MGYGLEMEQWQREQEQWDRLDELQKENPDKYEYYQSLKDEISRRVMDNLARRERDKWINDVGQI